jgi:acetylornithine deacetylase/succinyl-diaminopimelate desuccinylase-like protein
MLGGESGGGTNFNAVPTECWFTMAHRINPEEGLAAERTRLLDVLERCKQDGIPLDWEIFRKVHQPSATKMDRSAKRPKGYTP